MNCICFSSKSTSSTFSPARNVLSMTRPCRMCLSLVRTKAPPLPGLTCWKSTMLYGCPSSWIFRPFLKSAVDTTMVLWPLPSLRLDPERLLQSLPGDRVARILVETAQEDLSRLVHQPLLEANGAERLRGERVVGEQRRQRRALRRLPAPPQHFRGQARLAISGIQPGRLLQMAQRGLQAPRLSMELAEQAVRLRVPGPRGHDGLQRRAGLVDQALIEQGLGEDQAGRRVVREAVDALATEPDGLLRPADLSIGVGEGSEGQRSGILGQALFMTAYGRGLRGIVSRHTGAGPRNRLNHGGPVIRGPRGASQTGWPLSTVIAWPARPGRERDSRARPGSRAASARPRGNARPRARA